GLVGEVVAVDPDHRPVEHATSGVDLAHRQLRTGEHRRTGAGQVTGVREQRADAQHAVGLAAWGRRNGLGRGVRVAGRDVLGLVDVEVVRAGEAEHTVRTRGRLAGVGEAAEAERDALVRDVLAGLDRGQAARRAVARFTTDGD